MIQNYLKIAIRSIFRNKLTAFINIAGLAIAMASALMIYLFVTDEISYDKYNKNADRVYRVTRNFLDRNGVPNLHLATVAPPIGPLMKNDYGEIERMARTLQFNLVMAIEENGERSKIASENEVYLTEPDLFKIFDVEVLSGNANEALKRPYTIMLSESMAKKYFESTDVIGKHMKGGRRFDFEVTGVYKNFPRQSHWHPDFMVSFSTLEDSTVYGKRGLETNWGNNAFSTYILLEPGADPKKLESQLPAFLDKHLGPFAIANFGVPANFVASQNSTLFVQKVTDVHLKSHLDDELEVGGNIDNVYMMGVIGLFIVLIACFNFINLSTARATKRAKEVGMRKVAGAFKNQLVFQYLSESVVVTFFALVLSIGLAMLSLQWLNNFTQKALSLNISTHWPVYAGLIVFAVIVGIIAGIYPAFVISSFKPVQVLKGQQGSVKGKGGIRKTLVVAQFVISIALIIATAITIQQLDYLNSRNLGFDKDKVITVPYYSELTGQYDAFYNELLKSSSIKNVATSSRLPTGRLLDSQGAPQVRKGDSLVNTGVSLKMVVIDYEFFDTYNIQLAAGRNFSKSIPTDDSLAFIINETAARAIGWPTNEEGIDKDFVYGGVNGKLIGIVKDFHFESLHQEIAPMSFFVRTGNSNNISIKIAANNLQDGVEHINRVWKSFLPIRPFDYQFVSDRYSRLYDAEQKQGQLFTVFSGMAIFIACLGLFGLATFNTMQRVKEIGIRKVLGASVPSILSLLSREIVILVLIANLFAWPIAWIVMSKWLDTFAYHINMNLLIYVVAAFAAVLVALATVSAQTIKAAMTNPSNTLRYE